ncbi:MAG: peptidoglycan editing factor PgeF [Actinomycetia bacterium]|nr:peptidoglycan editing factor PgeF [Actinomycetes bacterium]
MGVRAAGRQWSSDSGLQARWVFTDRLGGFSQGAYASLNLADHVGDSSTSVAANRMSLAGYAGLAPDALAVMQAAHGKKNAVVTQPGLVADVDALITAESGLGLVALAADCVPLALLDAQAGVVAAIHSGWRGVAANVVQETVGEMITMGANPERMLVGVGPAICPTCYEVSPQVQEQVMATTPAARGQTAQGTTAIDLHGAVTAQLQACGVQDIRCDSRCTYEAEESLFSYRRDGVTGRQGVVVWLEAYAA